MRARAFLGPSLDERLWAPQLLPMSIDLAFVAPQGALDFPKAFPLVGTQEARVTASHFGDFISALFCHIRFRPAPSCSFNLSTFHSVGFQPIYPGTPRLTTARNAGRILSDHLLVRHEQAASSHHLQGWAGRKLRGRMPRWKPVFGKPST